LPQHRCHPAGDQAAGFRRAAAHLWLLLLVAGCGGSDGDRSGGPLEPAPPAAGPALRVVAGGGNVNERYTSDLWVHGGYAYTGTYGSVSRAGNRGDVVKIWRLLDGGAPELADSINVPGIGTVSDLEVSDDGAVLMFSAERSTAPGLYLYALADPERPEPLAHVVVPDGLHTATFGTVGGRRYAFAARNPPASALLVYDVTDPTRITPVTTVPVPPSYGIHDTFVRDGVAFVFAWNTGVIIYDVGNGLRGGSPESPVEVSRLVTAANGLAAIAAHNGWWFHNPVTAERRYLFVGQEGPGIVGAQSSGDIHVLDVSDLGAPREVAFFHLPDAGTHNFWMDEARQILYAAYYNGGVVALDVSGELNGDLADRLISSVLPGGADNTYTWGVQLAGGSLYASDMLTGFWQLRLE
jgi:hypothetical protein